MKLTEKLQYIQDHHFSAWLIVESEPGLYTVGFYSPDSKWHPESDHDKKEEAAKRVNYLNGNKD